MDTLDLGELYAFTAIDTFTREAQVVIRSALQAKDGKAALEQVMRAFGRCEVIQTDGGFYSGDHTLDVNGSIVEFHVD